jgi:hypothetical protein
LKFSNSSKSNFGYFNIADDYGNLYWSNNSNGSNYALTNAF